MPLNGLTGRQVADPGLSSASTEGRSAAVRRVRMLAGFASLVLGGGAAVFAWLPSRYQYQIEERFSFAGAQPGQALLLALVLPRSGPYQRLSDAQISWDGDVTREIDGEVEVLKLLGTAGPNGAREAIVSFEVSVFDGRVRWQGEVRGKHVEPGHLIESDAPPLVAEASRLAADASRDDAVAIFAFVSDHVEWSTPTKRERDGIVSWSGGTGSALDAYKARSGGCEEFANLTVALLRAAGLPARTIDGLAFPRMGWRASRTKEWGHPAGAHAWIEVHTGSSWEMADPGWAANAGSTWAKRRLFGRSDGLHLSYGDADEARQRVQRLRAWALERGTLVCQMSAPLRFVAAVHGTKCAFTPSATVKLVSAGIAKRTILGLAMSVFLGSALLLFVMRPRPRVPRGGL